MEWLVTQKFESKEVMEAKQSDEGKNQEANS